MLRCDPPSARQYGRPERHRPRAADQADRGRALQLTRRGRGGHGGRRGPVHDSRRGRRERERQRLRVLPGLQGVVGRDRLLELQRHRVIADRCAPGQQLSRIARDVGVRRVRVAPPWSPAPAAGCGERRAAVRPGGPGSRRRVATHSAALGSVETTLAVVLAVYVLAVPGVNAPKIAARRASKPERLRHVRGDRAGHRGRDRRRRSSCSTSAPSAYVTVSVACCVAAVQVRVGRRRAGGRAAIGEAPLVRDAAGLADVERDTMLEFVARRRLRVRTRGVGAADVVERAAAPCWRC